MCHVAADCYFTNVPTLVGNKGEMFVGLMGRSITNGGEHKHKTNLKLFQNIKAALLILKLSNR